MNSWCSQWKALIIKLTSACIEGKNIVEVALLIGDKSPGEAIRFIGDLIKEGENGSIPDKRGNPEKENLSSIL